MSGTYCFLYKIETRGFLTPQQTGINFCFCFSVSCCLSSLLATPLSSHFSDLRPATPSLSSYYHCRAETEREKETLPSTPLQKKPPSITHWKPNPNTITSSLHQKPIPPSITMDLLHYIAFFQTTSSSSATTSPHSSSSSLAVSSSTTARAPYSLCLYSRSRRAHARTRGRWRRRGGTTWRCRWRRKCAVSCPLPFMHCIRLWGVWLSWCSCCSHFC